MRIVSLLPAATEICYELGLGDALVGVSPECDYPAQVRGKRIVSRSLLDYSGQTSGETSRSVGERLAAGAALYQVDEPALRSAEPEVILTQGLCDVCAPTLGDVEDVAARLSHPPEILSLDPHSLDDVLGDIERVGQLCGVEKAAQTAVASLRARIERVAARASEVRERPTAVCLEWLDPLFLAGHWVPEMVALAGAVDPLVEAGEPSRRADPSDIVEAAPEIVVLMPCGFDLERTRREASLVTRAPWWRQLPAAGARRVWTVDGSGYFSRPGPRLIEGLEILAHILHPERFPSPPDPSAALLWVG